MDTADKISVSPRGSWKRTTSFGVVDPSDAGHFPALPGPASPPAASERRLSRLSSSFKDKLSTAESVGQVAPASISTSSLPPSAAADTEAAEADSPKISAIRPTAVEGPADSPSFTRSQFDPTQRAPSCDEEGFRLVKSRKSRSPRSTRDSPAVASQLKVGGKMVISDDPFAVLAVASADSSKISHLSQSLSDNTVGPCSRTLSGNMDVMDPAGNQEVESEDFPFAVLVDCHFEEEDSSVRAEASSSVTGKSGSLGSSTQDIDDEETVLPTSRNLGGRAVHGLKGIVSSIKANPKTSALVALGIVVGARLLFARSRRAI